MEKSKKMEVPIWEKQNLTVKEAAAYSGIGESTIRSMLRQKNCEYLLRVGSKLLNSLELYGQFGRTDRQFT